MEDQEIKNEIVNTMLNKRIVGKKNSQIETVVSRYAAIPTHAEGKAKDLVDDLVQEGVVVKYGGTRATIRLSSVDRAVEYLKDNDGNVPFGFG